MSLFEFNTLRHPVLGSLLIIAIFFASSFSSATERHSFVLPSTNTSFEITLPNGYRPALTQAERIRSDEFKRVIQISVPNAIAVAVYRKEWASADWVTKAIVIQDVGSLRDYQGQFTKEVWEAFRNENLAQSESEIKDMASEVVRHIKQNTEQLVPEFDVSIDKMWMEARGNNKLVLYILQSTGEGSTLERNLVATMFIHDGHSEIVSVGIAVSLLIDAPVETLQSSIDQIQLRRK